MFTAYTAYFDASGHPDQQEVLTVSGYVSTVAKWSRFDIEWNQILKDEGVTEFHTTEFVSSKKQFANGWKGESDRRRRFIERLASCIKKNTNKAFRATVVLSGYNKINEEFRLEETLGRPYTLCALQCRFGVMEWARRKRVERKTLIYFEDGDKDKGNFEQRSSQMYKEKPLFLPKSRAAAFQAADLAAWKVRTLIQEAIKDDHTYEKGLRLTDSLAKLPQIPKDSGVLNSAALLEFCRRYNIPRRNKSKGVA